MNDRILNLSTEKQGEKERKKVPKSGALNQVSQDLGVCQSIQVSMAMQHFAKFGGADDKLVCPLSADTWISMFGLKLGPKLGPIPVKTQVCISLESPLHVDTKTKQNMKAYLLTVQGFPELSRDLGICPGVQGFSPFVQGFSPFVQGFRDFFEWCYKEYIIICLVFGYCTVLYFFSLQTCNNYS